MTDAIILGFAAGMAVMAALDHFLFSWLAHSWAQRRRVRARLDVR